MNIIPAIDLQSGQCVRLHQGDFNQVTVYDQLSPEAVAKSFVNEGANFLHVVDLDGAKQGTGVQGNLITALCAIPGLAVQTGGGIRTQEQIDNLFSAGVQRVVIGSMAITQIATVKNWLNFYGAEKIVLALDVFIENQQPYLMTHGWQKKDKKTLWELIDNYADTDLKHVLCTDIKNDGTLAGPNLKLYETFIEKYPHISIQASGGISQLNDLSELKKIGTASAIVGKAFYERRFTFTQAMQVVQSQ